MKIFNNIIFIFLSGIPFVSFNLISMPARSEENKRDHKFIVYTFWRPPYQLSGTIDSKGNYYYFTNARPVKCDLKIDSGCYMKSKQAATIISPAIIQVGNAYACAESLITKEREKTEHLAQFSFGYGTCTQQGWVPKKNP